MRRPSELVSQYTTAQRSKRIQSKRKPRKKTSEWLRVAPPTSPPTGGVGGGGGGGWRRRGAGFQRLAGRALDGFGRVAAKAARALPRTLLGFE